MAESGKKEKDKGIGAGMFITLTLVATILVGTLAAVVISMSLGIGIKDVKKMMGKEEVELFSEPFSLQSNVDLVSGEGHYIQSEIIFSMYDADLQSEIKEKYKYPIQDILVSYVNRQDKKKLSDPNKRDKVKAEIIGSIEKELGIDLKGLYFVNYAVQ